MDEDVETLASLVATELFEGDDGHCDGLKVEERR